MNSLVSPVCTGADGNVIVLVRTIASYAESWYWECLLIVQFRSPKINAAAVF